MPKNSRRQPASAPAALAIPDHRNAQEIHETPAGGLTLTVHLGPAGMAQFHKFLGEQQIAHAEAESLFPGYEFVIGHWPPVDFWEVEVKVGPAFVLIEDAVVRLEKTEKTIAPPR